MKLLRILLIVLIPFLSYAQANYKTITNTTSLIGFATESNYTSYTNVDYTKEFPFIDIGGGNWVSGINSGLVNLDFKTDLGAGLYYKLKKAKTSHVKDIRFKADYNSKQPISSDFVIDEEIKLIPEQVSIRALESIILEMGAPEIEIGIFIRAGAAMRLKGSGVDVTLFSAPPSFANSSGAENIEIPLLNIKEGKLSLPVDLPTPIANVLNKYIAAKGVYYTEYANEGKDKGFHLNVPKLGISTRYRTHSLGRISPRYASSKSGSEVIEVNDNAIKVADLNDDFSFSIDLTQFLNYFADRALEGCRACTKLKILKALLFKYENKNVIVGKLNHHGLQVNGHIGLSLQNVLTVAPEFAITYSLDKNNSITTVPYKVIKKNDPTHIVREEIDTNHSGFMKLNFDEQVVFNYPIDFAAPNEVFLYSAITMESLGLKQEHRIKERNSIDYNIFYGSFKPSKGVKKLVRWGSLGFTSVPDVNYGPIFSGRGSNRFTTNSFSPVNYEVEEGNFSASNSGGDQRIVGNLTSDSVIFTGTLPNVVLNQGETIDVKELYLGNPEGYTFSPEFITTLGTHTINVTGANNHSFSIITSRNTAPVIKNGHESNYLNLMGEIDEEGTISYVKINASSLVKGTNTNGEVDNCSFVNQDILSNLSFLFEAIGSGAGTSITAELLEEDNANLNLNNLPFGKHKITYSISDELGNKDKYIRYIEIVNDFDFEFTLDNPVINRMLNEDGKLKLVFSEEETNELDATGYELVEVLYTLTTPEFTCGEDFKMSVSRANFDCSALGENKVTVTLTKGNSSYSQELTLNVITNPSLDFNNNSMYINKDATGNETGVDMENGFKDLDKALNLLPCRIENVENVYIKHGDYYAYSTDADYSNYNASYNYNDFNEIRVKQDLNFESIEGVSTFKFSNFFIEAGVTATFTNINFENSTIIADENSKVILKNCAFETNQFAIVSVGTVEAYNTTFVNSQGGRVSYEGPSNNFVHYNSLFEIKDPEGKCEFTNAYGDSMVSQDVGLFYLFGGEGTSKFINCSFNNNTVVFDGTPGGMFCSTNVEFSNCIFDTTVAVQWREGQLFGVGEDVTLTLKNNLINTLNRSEGSLPTAEESLCDDPNVICENNQFFITPDTEPNYFPGPNFFGYVDPYGEDSDGNPYNYNLRLKEGSIAIDAGDDSLYPSEINLTTDLGGENRFCGSSIDVGAFEYNNCGTLGNDDVTKDGKFVFYPIPSKDYIFIRGGTKEEKTYYVFDNYGNLVKKGQCINQINVSTLSTGLYFIKIEIGNSAITQKIIKK